MDNTPVIYSNRATWKLLDELLSDPYLFTQITEEQQAYGNWTAQSLRSFVHTELWVYVTTNLLDVEWQEVADSLNNREN